MQRCQKSKGAHLNVEKPCRLTEMKKKTLVSMTSSYAANERLVSSTRKKEKGGQRSSDSCVPDRQWMAQVHLEAAALDQHDVYVFTSKRVPSIPPSPWWPTVTASQGPQPQSNGSNNNNKKPILYNKKTSKWQDLFSFSQTASVPGCTLNDKAQGLLMNIVN